MKIGYLADYPEFIPTLAHWHHDEWGYLRTGESVEARMARLRSCCHRRQVPTVIVALNDNSLCGSAMLVAYDMETRMQWSPWLAGVFVTPDHRRRGIGTALTRRVVEEATTLGVRRLYLYTPGAEKFNLHLGWSLVERTSYRGAEVAVMSYDARIEDTSAPVIAQ